MTRNKWELISFTVARVLTASLVIAILAGASAAQDPTGRPSSSSTSKSHKKKKAKPDDTTPEEITVDLTVMTQPPDCQVLINGEARGTSGKDGKVLFNKLSQGHYVIEVRKAGFTAQTRNFEAGQEAPTVVIKLAADIGDKLKQFNDLMSAGKFIGPDSPNAFDLADDLVKNYSDRPEVANIRSTLFQRLVSLSGETVNRTMKRNDATRDDIVKAQMLAAKAEVLNPDDRRAQALDLYYQGMISLRDWQIGQESGQAKAQQDTLLADAKDKLEKAVQLQDSIAAAQYHLGVVLLLSNDPAGAEGAFGKTAVLEPSWVVARLGLGDAFSAEGKRKDAADQYRQAVGLDANNCIAHAGLGLSLTMIGQSKDGIKEIEKAISLDQSAALPHYDLGLALAESKKKKDRERAAEELKKAIELNPKNIEFQNSAAQQVLATLEPGKKK